MKNIIEKIVERVHLDQEEAYHCMLQIGNNELSDAATVAIMISLQMRGLQLDELIGFRKALLELALPVELNVEHSMDVCGTGGDGKNTFNISTTTAFVLASMGYKIVKHGNYGVSSLCGSSNVLESLGYVFTKNTNELQRQLDKNNICFLHAPLFHPALKTVAPLRKALGIATFFNGMGPLVNPANPTHQISGTYSLELAKQYQHVLRTVRTNFTVIHGLEGFDELTFLGTTRLLGKFRDEVISAAPNQNSLILQDLQAGATTVQSAEIIIQILSGKGTAAQNTVIAGNVALGLQTFHPEMNFETAFHTAYEQLLGGHAIHHLQTATA